MKVLIAVDYSPSSQRLLDEVLVRPWPAETAFCIVHAVDLTLFAEHPALVDDAVHEGERLVKAGTETLARVYPAALSKVLRGSPRHVISAYATEWGADLILVGSHGKSAVSRFLLGSVAQSILRKAHCSVEIVRTHTEAPPPSSHAMKMLVTTDGSECSLTAAHSIANRPWPAGTLFRVLSVEELAVVEGPMLASSSSAIYPTSLLEELMEAARTRASDAAESTTNILKKASLKMCGTHSIPVGDPRTNILDTAKEWQADLIVLGSHGRSGLDRFLLGSVSEAVAIHAHCLVEVIRHPAHAVKK